MLVLRAKMLNVNFECVAEMIGEETWERFGLFRGEDSAVVRGVVVKIGRQYWFIAIQRGGKMGGEVAKLAGE